MFFDRDYDRDRDARRRERDDWTDIAYLIVAAVSLVLAARLWARVLQPWAAGVIAQLTRPDLLLWAVALGFVVVAAMRVCATHRRRAGSRVAEGHHAVTRSALDTARSRAHAAARVGGSHR